MNPETEQLEEVQDRPVFTATTRLNAAMQQEAKLCNGFFIRNKFFHIVKV